MTQVFPLQWPEGRPRTPSHQRQRAPFGTSRTRGTNSWKSSAPLTVSDALDRIQQEVDRLGARHVVLSTNVELRLDGLPRSNQRPPDDPGVSLYFQLDGKPIALCCDKWDRVADNIAAIAKHIDAMRGMERWGVGSKAELYAGFTQLAAPDAPKTWREILGFPPTARPSREDIASAYRVKAKQLHPDHGGSNAAFAELAEAYAQAQKEVG